MNAAPPPHLWPALTAMRGGDLPTARREAEQAARQHPGDPIAHHLAGVLCCQAGDLPAGVSHLEHALRLAPQAQDVRLMLARALVDTGQHRRALDLVAEAPSPALAEVAVEAAQAVGDPAAQADALGLLVRARGGGDATLLRAHGHALARAGRLGEAADALIGALQQTPGDVDLRAELAALLADLDDHQGALAAFADAATLAPARADFRIGQGRALTRLRRFEEASEIYAAVVDADPGNLIAVRECGVLLERVGRIADLPALLVQAEAGGIAPADLSLLRAMLALENGDLPLARTLANAATDDDPVKRFRLLSKIEEKAGDIRAAFEASAAMNAAVPDRALWLARGAEARAEIRRLAAALTSSPPPTPSDRPGERRSPAFIVGFPRSGTTLLDTILMGHPDVAVLEEEPMLEAAKEVVGDLADLWLRTPEEIAEARAAYFRALDERLDPAFSGLVVDKMPFNMLGAGLILRLFPDARFVFAQRHPCDVVVSGFMQSFRLNAGMASFLDIRDAADLYDAAMSLWTASRERLPLTVHDLVYEQLVQDVESQLRPLVAFLGLDWDPALLDHRRTAAKRGMIITPSYDQVTKPITARAAGRWRKLAAELEPALPLLAPWVERLGYEPIGDRS